MSGFLTPNFRPETTRTTQSFSAFVRDEIILASIASTQQAVYVRMTEALEIDLRVFKIRGYVIRPVVVSTPPDMEKK